MVGIAGENFSYGLKLADGKFVDLNLDQAQPTMWPGTNEVIDWRSAGGSPVDVFGQMNDDGTIVVDMMQPPEDPVQMESAISAASGTFRVLAIPLTFNHGSRVGTARELDTTLHDVEQRIEEASFGKVNMTYDVASPVDITFTKCRDEFYKWLDAATNGAKAEGIDLGRYNTFALVGDPPYDRQNEPSCGWAGLGSQGGQGVISKVLQPSVFVHELGHNFGLVHGSSEYCAENGVQVPMSSRANCRMEAEYGDRFNAMGISNYQYVAQYKAQIGWLAPSQILTPERDQDVTLAPMTAPSDKTQLLRIPGPDGSFYTVEFMQPSRSNPVPSDHPSVNGVIIHVHYADDPGRARLLDMNPGSRINYEDAALGVGKSHTFFGTHATLQVLSVGPDGARLRITGLGGGSGGGGDSGGGDSGGGDSGGGDSGGGGDTSVGDSLVSTSSRKCVAIRSASQQSGAAVVQQPCDGSRNQSWEFQDVGSGRFVLKDVNSGKCLDVRGGTARERELIQQATCNGSTSQKWKLVDMGAGKISLRNGNSGKCLDTLSGSTADGAQFIQYTCKGFTSQKFERR